MKTETHIEQERAAHHKALEALATNGANGLSLWRNLRRLEIEVRRAATAQCNGEAYEGQSFRNETEWEDYLAGVETVVLEIMGTVPEGFYVNDDPRGYALKIESHNLPLGMRRDWGNDGILAPVIE